MGRPLINDRKPLLTGWLIGGLWLVGGTALAGDLNLSSGATLKGNGTVNGVVKAASGSIVAPGIDGPGVLASGGVTLSAGANLAIQLGGTSPGSAADRYDQLTVTGAVSLGGATLGVTAHNGFSPSHGDTFVIIDQDGSDAVSGSFNGLAEGGSFAFASARMFVTYQGGDGNDVVLSYVVDTTPPSVTAIAPAGSPAADAASVQFSVTFDEAVSQVSADDFTLTADATLAAAIASVSGSGTAYTVTLAPISGSGSVRLDLKAGSDIVDAGGNAPAAFTAGSAYQAAVSRVSAVAPLGAGTSGDPYRVTTAAHLSWLAQSGVLSAHYRQDGDLDLSQTRYWDAGDDDGDGDRYNDPNDATADGANDGWPTLGLFSGVYDGGGYAIDRLQSTQGGLFGEVRGSDTIPAEIKNLGLTDVDISGRAYTAPLVERLYGNAVVERVFTTGAVSQSGPYTAGVVAQALYNGTDAAVPTIRTSWSSVAVSESGASAHVGGLVGAMEGGAGRLIDSHFVGSVSAAHAATGGLIGTIGAGVTVERSYSAATLSGAGGGLSGTADAASTTGASFWDNQRAAVAASASGEAKTTTAMQARATFEGAGWEFDADANGDGVYWKIDSRVNGGYPYLSWRKLMPVIGTLADIATTSRSAQTAALSVSDLDGTVASLAVSSSDTAVATVSLSGDSGVGASRSATIDITYVGEGASTITVSATNDRGERASRTFRYGVDSVAPRVSSVGVPADALYPIGGVLDFTVRFDERVMVSGVPQLPITLAGGTTVNALYQRGSGGTDLVFRHQVAPGELGGDGVTVGGALLANGATLADAAGNDALLTLTDVAATRGVRVDGVAPSVSAITPVGTPGAGDASVLFAVSFSERVSGVSGADFALTTGGSAGGAIASVAGGGANYTVTVDTLTGDGGVRLDLRAATDVVDAANNATAAFSGGTAHAVDRLAPTVSAAHIALTGATGGGGFFKAGDRLTATWNGGAGGDANHDTISAVTMDFGAFGGGAAVSARQAAGRWSAGFTLAEGGIDATMRNVVVRVVDDAGNTTTRTDDADAGVDNQSPGRPTGSLMVAEEAAGGTLVGTVSGGGGDAVSYSLVDDAGGRFVISAAGAVTVAAGARIDFETAASHTITVRARDDAGNATDAVLTVRVANRAPTLSLPGGGDVLPPAVGDGFSDADGISVADLLGGHGIDAADANGGALGIAVIAMAGAGRWEYSVGRAVWTTFGAPSGSRGLLLSDTTRLRYRSSGGDGQSPLIRFRAWDQSGAPPSADGAPSVADTTLNGGGSAFSVAVLGATARGSLSDAPSAPPTVVVDGDRGEVTPSAGTTVNVREGGLDGTLITLPSVAPGGVAGRDITLNLPDTGRLGMSAHEADSRITLERVQLVGEQAPRPTPRVTGGSASATASAPDQALLTAGGITVVSGREGSRATATVDPVGGSIVAVSPGDRVVVNQGVSETDAQVDLIREGGGGSSSISVTTGRGERIEVEPESPASRIRFTTVEVEGVAVPIPTVVSGSVTVRVPAAGAAFLTIGSSTLESVAGGALTAGARVEGDGVVTFTLRAGEALIRSAAEAARRAPDGVLDRLFAGETADFDADGTLQRIRLGSPGRDGGEVGDHLLDGRLAAEEEGIAVTRIEGGSARNGAGVSDLIAAVVAAQSGWMVENLGQEQESGIYRIRLTDPLGEGSTVIAGWPVSDLVVEEGADRIIPIGNGMVRVRAGNLALNIAPAAHDVAALGVWLAERGLSRLSVGGAGVILATAPEGDLVAAQPGWERMEATDGELRLSGEESGVVWWSDADSGAQPLYPVFANLSHLHRLLGELAPGYELLEVGRGRVTIRVDGERLDLIPDYTLTPVPRAYVDQTLWREGEHFHLHYKGWSRNGVVGWVQGFRVEVREGGQGLGARGQGLGVRG